MSIQSIDRAFDIIELLSQTPRGMILSDMAAELSLPVSTVYRITADLVKKGYVDKNSELNLYKIGIKFLDLTGLFRFNLELKTEAQPVLMELSRQTGYPVFLATMMDHEVCYIDRVYTAEVDSAYSVIGQRRSLFSTALGKSLILNRSDKEILALIEEKGMVYYTLYSITDPDVFLKVMEECRKKGWTTDNQEDRLDFQCVGAPIYDYKNDIVASVSTSWNKVHFGEKDVEKVAPIVMAAAEQISKRLSSR